jgi:hypothetical protein
MRCVLITHCSSEQYARIFTTKFSARAMLYSSIGYEQEVSEHKGILNLERTTYQQTIWPQPRADICSRTIIPSQIAIVPYLCSAFEIRKKCNSAQTSDSKQTETVWQNDTSQLKEMLLPINFLLLLCLSGRLS